MKQTLKAAALYFALVFGAGFLLGCVRVLWAVPRFGVRVSELVEAPIMLAVTFLAARSVVRRLAGPRRVAARLGVGFLALGLLLAIEFTVVLRLQGLTLKEHLANRDPAAAAVYGANLVLFALMPLLVARETGHP